MGMWNSADYCHKPKFSIIANLIYFLCRFLANLELNGTPRHDGEASHSDAWIDRGTVSNNCLFRQAWACAWWWLYETPKHAVRYGQQNIPSERKCCDWRSICLRIPHLWVLYSVWTSGICRITTESNLSLRWEQHSSRFTLPALELISSTNVVHSHCRLQFQFSD